MINTGDYSLINPDDRWLMPQVRALPGAPNSTRSREAVAASKPVNACAEFDRWTMRGGIAGRRSLETGSAAARRATTSVTIRADDLDDLCDRHVDDSTGSWVLAGSVNAPH